MTTSCSGWGGSASVGPSRGLAGRRRLRLRPDHDERRTSTPTSTARPAPGHRAAALPCRRRARSAGAPGRRSSPPTAPPGLGLDHWSADRTGAGAQLRAYDPSPGSWGAGLQHPIGTSTNYSMPGVGNDGRSISARATANSWRSARRSPSRSGPGQLLSTTKGSIGHPALDLTANEPMKVSNVVVDVDPVHPRYADAGSAAPAQNDRPDLVPVTFAPSQPGLGAARSRSQPTQERSRFGLRHRPGQARIWIQHVAHLVDADRGGSRSATASLTATRRCPGPGSRRALPARRSRWARRRGTRRPRQA